MPGPQTLRDDELDAEMRLLASKLQKAASPFDRKRLADRLILLGLERQRRLSAASIPTPVLGVARVRGPLDPSGEPDDE